MEDIKHKKIIELPSEALKDLSKLADADKRKLKPYIELVLIKHSKKAEKLSK